MDICLRVLKESNKSRLDSYSVRERSYPILPFGVVVSTFVRTTFLEIAVYYLRPDLEPSLLGHYSGAKRAQRSTMGKKMW